jgi:hypothetical protein
MMLRDGVALIVRAICPNDTRRLRVFHSRLSLQTIYLRFFRMLPVLPLEMAERLTHVDYKNRFALVATTGVGDDEQIVAVVRYKHAGPTAGEVAFVVKDRWQGHGRGMAGAWQGHGIATPLLHQLAEYARACAYMDLVAQTMGWNTWMHSPAAASRLPGGVVRCRRHDRSATRCFPPSCPCRRSVAGGVASS